MNFFKNVILPRIVASFYWVWSHLWRLTIIEAPGLTKIKKTQRVIFCHWHGDELVVIRLGPSYHCAAMTSTSKDGELMDKVLNILGFGTSRGSSTRGGARALIGMIKLMENGYHATMAIDGPKGPRHKAKPGAWALSKHTGSPIIPMGVARKSAFVFNKSWNKTYLPWPFTKVVVTFGEPMFVNNIDESTFCTQLEKQLFLQKGLAQTFLKSILVPLFLILTSCSSAPTTSQTTSSNNGAESLLEKSVHTPLKPKGLFVTGFEPATLQFIKKGGIADKMGFKWGDTVLKINGRNISGYYEFEKKLSNSVSPAEITYKSKNLVLTKRVPLSSNKNRWDASTEKQNILLIKKSSPNISFINKNPITVFCSASISEEKNSLFVNIIIDSDEPRSRQSAPLTIGDLKNKVYSKSLESIDALGANSVLVSKKLPLPTDLSSGLKVGFTLGKQQFTFEFTN